MCHSKGHITLRSDQITGEGEEAADKAAGCIDGMHLFLGQMNYLIKRGRNVNNFGDKEIMPK